MLRLLLIFAVTFASMATTYYGAFRWTRRYFESKYLIDVDSSAHPVDPHDAPPEV